MKYKRFPSLLVPNTALLRLVMMLLTTVSMLLSGPLTADDENSTIFLVRHAEKLLDVEDPGLSAAGKQRAKQLAVLLEDAEITAIFSTDYQRTRDTATPLATAENLEITLYDPAEPEHLVELIKNEQGRYLVVGHSNTTPDLVTRLGGNPGSAIDEKTEYNRLYVLTLDDAGKVTTVLLRY